MVQKFRFAGRRMCREELRFGLLRCIRTRSPAGISSLPGRRTQYSPGCMIVSVETSSGIRSRNGAVILRDDPDGPKGRVASFAECNGKLFAAAYDTVYERADGKSPAWKKVFGTTIHCAEQPSHRLSRPDVHWRSFRNRATFMLVGVEDNPSAHLSHRST